MTNDSIVKQVEDLKYLIYELFKSVYGSWGSYRYQMEIW